MCDCVWAVGRRPACRLSASPCGHTPYAITYLQAPGSQRAAIPTHSLPTTYLPSPMPAYHSLPGAGGVRPHVSSLSLSPRLSCVLHRRAFTQLISSCSGTSRSLSNVQTPVLHLQPSVLPVSLILFLLVCDEAMPVPTYLPTGSFLPPQLSVDSTVSAYYCVVLSLTGRKMKMKKEGRREKR